MKNKLAIFDLDGTLFDTKYLNYLAYNEAVGKFGKSIDRDFFFAECYGRHYTQFIPKIMGGENHLKEIHELKKTLYTSFLGQTKVNHHLFAFIEGVRDNYYTAIVTTASRENTLQLLRYYNCEQYFDSLITQENVKNAKPDPEGFLAAMAAFSVDADHTVIFEDSVDGIAAARKTGATVFAVDQF